MTTAKLIDLARSYLPNTGAYARTMSANIRSARSARSANQFRAAIAADKLEAAFIALHTDCPTSKAA